MQLRIAIPEPTAADHEYNQRALPPYLAALQSAGAVPLLVPLHERPDRIARLLASAQGILLPGSRYDIDPKRFNEVEIPQCGTLDPVRTAVDELLLQDAFNLRKPVLALCHGAQTLNVWCGGSLFQDLPTQVGTAVHHAPGRDVTEAHPVRITPGTRLAALLPPGEDTVQVNSSHHQAIRTVGRALRVVAVSLADSVVEAVELDSPDHWVVAVQWHPERTYAASQLSRALFAAFVHAARTWQPRPVLEAVARESVASR
ncbi:MAG TPA: gamma-glutamyl-gamma-aminobutyrate hydrolase family protein [Terracidiphilus sp.]|nr:gamma-glutamyl-gamma-aminobutyrate hydrolase family protein [Terracidiphilus sp.]